MSTRIAGSVVVDFARGTFTIDGHEFPYAVAAAGPQVQRLNPDTSDPAYVVQIPLMVDRATVITGDGDVAEYASPWAREPACTGPCGRAAADIAALGLPVLGGGCK